MNDAELRDLFVIQAARRLVEQQQLRLGDQRARELDPLERPERQPRRRPSGDVGDPDVVEDLARAAADGAAAKRPRAGVRADEHVVEHRHRAEQLDVLERARDPATNDAVRRRAQQALAVEAQRAGVRLVEPGDHVEERGLAGAVRPDQADDLPRLDVERDIVDRDDPAEPPRHVANLEQRHRLELSTAAGSVIGSCTRSCADVERRQAVDRRPAGEQRDVLGRAEGDDVRRARPGDGAAATSSPGEPTIASSRCGARCWSSATSSQPNAVGAFGSASRTRPKTDTARRSSSSSPQIRARRSRTYASIALPLGEGWSSSGFLRATSCSPSAGDWKKPPSRRRRRARPRASRGGATRAASAGRRSRRAARCRP